MIDQQLSRNFWLSESVRTGRRAFRTENQEYGLRRIPKIALIATTQLQPLRDVEGSIVPSSWVRCPGLNKDVGSLTISQHIKCEAVDYNKRGITHDRVETRRLFQHQLEIFKANRVMFGQLVFEAKEARGGWVYWIHSSLGAPFRPLHRCGEVKMRINHKGTLLEKVEFPGWRG